MSGSDQAPDGKRGVSLGAAVVADANGHSLIGPLCVGVRGDGDGAGRTAHGPAGVVAGQYAPGGAPGRRPHDQQVGAAVGTQLVQPTAHRVGEHTGQVSDHSECVALAFEHLAPCPPSRVAWKLW